MFAPDIRIQLDALLRWRRDVRHFRTEPLKKGALEALLDRATLAPSVGNAQPWRFVRVINQVRRDAVRDNFSVCNAAALNGYDGTRSKLYASLKLAGLEQAPEQLAVFCVREPKAGHGLGRRTMPETLDYSVVMAVHTLWLAARAQGIGVGWVSILEPVTVRKVLEVPEDWKLIAYLCIGYPQEEHDNPELVRNGWQERLEIQHLIEIR